jgi:prepilin-type processing-associated H-X9-DG protein/prepilin-type N-terminal cleavage/methylation domain-containing protein
MPSCSHLLITRCPTRRIDRCRRGFTLVELLVVIGIIALLISILLPALSRARQIAQRTACAAKLQQIVVAAQLQTMDHNGFYPLAGVLPGFLPADLEDPYSTHYDYLADNTSSYYPRFPAPITFSLAHEMSHRHVFDSGTNNLLGPEETDSQGLIRHFLCPSQASSTSEIFQQNLLYSCAGGSKPGYAIAYFEAQSYNFNEAVLGWDDVDKLNRLKGRARLVHQPSLTLFAADGLMGSVYDTRVPWSAGFGMAAWYNIVPYAPITLADAFTGDGKAGDRQNFDLRRHNGKMNVAFCDGHVETRNITAGDLASVFLIAP